MPKKIKLPNLEFDTSGSAVVRFFGQPALVSIHYAAAGVSMLKMICPDSLGIDPKVCRACTSVKASDRMLSVVWDVKLEKWALYMAPNRVFGAVFEQCQKQSVDPAMMEKGEGPDMILQRAGFGTEVVAMPETIGQVRGKQIEEWGERSLLFPPLGEAAKQLYKDSLWRLYSTTQEVEEAYPKRGREIDALMSHQNQAVHLPSYNTMFMASLVQQAPYDKEGPPSVPDRISPRPNGESCQNEKPQYIDDQWDLI